MSSLSSSQLSSATMRQLVLAFALSAGAIWLLAKLLREVSHRIFPAFIPGEPNTALLASVKKSTGEATAKDLENVREYDYVIVGTGTAGCVLANRLSEDKDVTILAIEAGHSDLKQLMSRIPAAFGQLYQTAADWNLFTAKEKECFDRKLAWPRGKMIGGCSSINAMIYNRGNPDDYDEWQRLGNKSWDFKSVLPYMNKAEGFSPSPADPLTHEEIQQHGRNGPWQTGYQAMCTLSRTFVDACEAVGIPKIRDFNTSKGMIGAAVFQTFIDQKGQRSSTAVSYLTQDVATRPNLSIASGQIVTKIIFDESGARPRAVGVEMASGKLSPIKYVVKAKREVIVSAGAVHTPHILKLSGIGPAEELGKFGIKVVRNLKGVGANLADHIYASWIFEVKSQSLQYLMSPVKSLPALIEWLRHGTGVMTSNVAEAGAFVRTADMPNAPASLKQEDLTSGPNAPDLEILSGPLAYIDHGRHIAPTSKNYHSVGPIILRPSSKGTITLASNSPFDEPIINANYMSTKHDQDLLLYGMKLSLDILETKPVKDEFISWYFPSKNPHSLNDKEILDCVRKHSETIYHPMCTARMGPKEDDNAVVDDRLRVHGIDGLRVVDASIFPTVVACHPCAPVVMVAEKAADLIKEDH